MNNWNIEGATLIAGSNGSFTGGVSALNLSASGVGGGLISGANVLASGWISSLTANVGDLVVSSINGATPGGGGGGGGASGISTFRISSINAYSSLTTTTALGNLWLNSNTGAFNQYNGSNWTTMMPQQFGVLNTYGVRIPESCPACWLDLADTSTRCLASNGSNVVALYNKVGVRDALIPSRGVVMSNFTGVGYVSSLGGITQGINFPINNYFGYCCPVPRGSIQIRNTSATLAYVGQINTPANTNNLAAVGFGIIQNDGANWAMGTTWNTNNGSPAITWNGMTSPPLTPNSPYICIFGSDNGTAFFRANGSNTQSNVLANPVRPYACAGFGTASGALEGVQYHQNNHSLSEGLVWTCSLYSGLANSNAFMAIEGYLAWKHNLTSVLPAGHLYKSNAPQPGTWII
jgi:hypothetical protein